MDPVNEAEVERLQTLLEPFRYRPPAPRSWRPQVVAGLLLAAAILLTVTQWPRAPQEGWSCGPGCTLAVGAWLETDTPVSLQVADIGTMQVAQGSRLRLVATSPEQHRLELAVGSLHATVIAPPRLLVVDTPTSTAVDLGCEYDLTVLEDGTGLLLVHSGWVALEADHAVVVPAGAAAWTRPGLGPGTPYFADAPVPWAEALERFDLTGDAASAEAVTDGARVQDTLTLWHLLARTEEAQRLRIIDRIRLLTPWIAWRQIDVDLLVALDETALDGLLRELTTAPW